MSTPPPPQGQNPYGQQQPGQPGQPPQGGFPPPQGQPGMPPQGGLPPQGGFPPPPPPKKNKGKIIAAACVGALALGGVAFAYFNQDDAKKLEVGDCLQNKGSNSSPDLEKLDCDDENAAYKVLKKVEGTTAMITCRSEPDAVSAFTLQEGSNSFTLCLGEPK